MKRVFVSNIGIIFAAIGAAMMAFGVYRNETADILSKAIRICLECIGIG